MRIGIIQPNLSFKAKEVTLYSDFDGTFLQPDALNNDYFQAFDDLRQERDGKFKLFITTGRRLEGNDKHGFLYTYDSLKAADFKIPKMEGVITSGGGDIFLFNNTGEIDLTPDPVKRAIIKEKTAWDMDFIIDEFKKIAEKLETNLKRVNKRSFHKFALTLDEPAKLEEFSLMAEEFFEQNGISGEARVSDNLYLSDESGNLARERGIKLAPVINGYRVDKDFDIAQAIDVARRENDFVIAAGNEINDRVMLNLFSYIGKPSINSCERLPKEGLAEMVEQIRKLPIGIIFVDNPKAKVSTRFAEMRSFIEEQRKLFPDKVRIIKPSEGKENTIVKASRELIDAFFKEAMPSPTSSTPSTTTPKTSKSNKGAYGAVTFGVLVGTALAGGLYYLKNHQGTKKD